jgi:nuclear pore complex protein Nup155
LNLPPGRIHLPLESRLEYLTLAVGNAKSHPISIGGRHETAIAFLADLEEKLDVAQVQLEVYNVLVPLAKGTSIDKEAKEKIDLLAKRLFTMSEASKWPSAERRNTDSIK